MWRQANPAVQVELVSGWKEIATYLRVGVRTVQRYEKQGGLPVRRAPGGKRGSVLATKEELDAWVNARPLRHKLGWKASLPERYTAAHEAFKKNLMEALAEQARLRDEMRQLRDDLHTSVELVHTTLRLARSDFGEEQLPSIPCGRRRVN